MKSVNIIIVTLAQTLSTTIQLLGKIMFIELKTLKQNWNPQNVSEQFTI